MKSLWGINVCERRLQPELMDEPGVDADLLRSALGAIARINMLSLSYRAYWPAIRELARRHPSRELRVLDVACGSGDGAVKLFQLARRAKLKLTIDGCDLSPTAVACANERADKHQVPCRFFKFDVLREQWPTDYDVIGSSLFLHHLTTEAAIEVLRQMAAATRHIVLANDLVRCRLGYFLARVGTQLLTRSPMVHFDGPASVAGAFTKNELRGMAQFAGMDGAKVTRSWPQRMLLNWNKP